MIKKISGLCVLTGALSACSTSNTVPLVTLYQSQYCHYEAPGLYQLDPKAWQQLTAGEAATPFATEIPLEGAANEAPKGSLKDPWADLPKQSRVILVSMGTRPTGGYAIALAEEKGWITHGVLQLPLILHTPDPDGFQTQQLTSPCVVIGAGPGRYTTAETRDLDKGASHSVTLR